MTAYITGLGLATGAESTNARSLDELVFTAASDALADAGIGREMVDGVCLGASDQLDARAISSMQLAGPAGAFLRDEIRVSDDGSTALAAAALRVEAGVSQRVLATSWTKASESPYDGAVGVNAEPILARPAALHPWATEALVTTRFASGIRHRH